jgi:hypothetical protein
MVASENVEIRAVNDFTYFFCILGKTMWFNRYDVTFGKKMDWRNAPIPVP